MTMLGIPPLPASPMPDTADTPIRFTAGHHFSLSTGADPRAVAASAAVPLSVILQVTKRCDFDCTFCSETLQMKDPSLEQLATMSVNLAGV